MRNICLDLQLHVEDSKTLQIDCLQEMNIKTQVNAKRRQFEEYVCCCGAVCHSTARQQQPTEVRQR
jgi:hypothetical protein